MTVFDMIVLDFVRIFEFDPLRLIGPAPWAVVLIGAIMKTGRICAWCLVASFVLAATSARAGVLYSQPTDDNGSFSSQNDTTSGGLGNFATSYDNFTLGTSATVTSVDWVGSYANPPTQGSITAFTLTFYSDDNSVAGGQPGAALETVSIPGNANETSASTDNAGDPVFTYSADISSSPLLAAAGTQYWLSIVPDMALPPQWGWETGTGGDGIAYQDFLGGRSQLSNDLAFTLNGTPAGAPVPEPGSLTLFTLCFATVGCFGWMKK